jgi:hypothetical protein
MIFRTLFLFIVFASLPATAQEMAQTDPAPFVWIGETGHQPISEMSGLVKSRTFDDVYWVHNDSGDRPRLFSVRRDGSVIFPGFLRGDFHGEKVEPNKQAWPGLQIRMAANIDWEDIAIEDDRLYIADTGNNGNARRDLGVYVLAEPNPRATDFLRAQRFLPVAYPEQQQYPAVKWHYDSESLFVDQGRIYLLTKHRVAGEIGEFERGVNLYRLNSQKTDEINVLKKIDSHESILMATGADLSPDGEHLAIVTSVGLWVFDRPRRGDKWLSSPARFVPIDPRVIFQTEAVGWDDNETLIITNEGRQMYSIKLEQLQEVDA